MLLDTWFFTCSWIYRLSYILCFNISYYFYCHVVVLCIYDIYCPSVCHRKWDPSFVVLQGGVFLLGVSEVFPHTLKGLKGRSFTICTDCNAL